MLARAVPGALVVVGREPLRRRAATPSRRSARPCTCSTTASSTCALARDLDIVVTPAGALAGDRVLPMGRLREPLDALTPRLDRWWWSAPATTRPPRPRRRATASQRPSVRWRRARRGDAMRERRAAAGAPVVAVAGIGAAAAVRRGARGRRLARRRHPAVRRSPLVHARRPGRDCPHRRRTRRLGRADHRQGRRAARAARPPLPCPMARVPLVLDVARWDRLTDAVAAAIADAAAAGRGPGAGA